MIDRGANIEGLKDPRRAESKIRTAAFNPALLDLLFSYVNIDDVNIQRSVTHVLYCMSNGSQVPLNDRYAQISIKRDILDVLLSYKIDVDTPFQFLVGPEFCDDGKRLAFNTLLHMSIASHDIELAKLLIEHGANVNTRQCVASLEPGKNKSLSGRGARMTPLELALTYKFQDLVVLLIENGAKI